MSGPRLAPRVRALSMSPTVGMSLRAAELRARGESVLDFTVGEPDQPTPAHVVAAAKAALDAGETRYTPSAGTRALREAVAARYRADTGAEFAVEEVAVTAGGKQALHLACQALLDRGGEVVVPTPAWPSFAEAARLAAGRPVPVRGREEEGYALHARRLQRSLTARTRALVVNTPANPTGAVIEPGELLALGRLARRRGFALFYDDTYSHLTFRPQRPSLLRELQEEAGEQLVVLGTASKSYCMTGWRIGWILGARPLVEACVNLVSHSTQCPAAFAQAGALAALRGPQDFVGELRREYARRLDILHPLVSGWPGVSCARPQGAFYLFPSVRGRRRRGTSSYDLAMKLLEEERVAVVPGEAFDAPGHLRISFARGEAELREGARRMGSFFTRMAG